MLSKRIIPCLDVKNGEVVKGINFLNLKKAGDPVELAEKYSNLGADEICFLDITATLEGRKAMLEVIRKTAKKVFIPMTVGGGVNNSLDIAEILKSGADKVAINSGAVKNPDLIKESANKYGSQCTVLAVDSKKTNKTKSGWEVFTKGGTQETGIDTLQWISDCVNSGAGEILLTSMDADGTKNGYDIELTSAVCKIINIPVIASGGAGNISHITEVLQKTGAEAALLASLLHYEELTISEIKQELISQKIPIRPII